MAHILHRFAFQFVSTCYVRSRHYVQNVAWASLSMAHTKRLSLLEKKLTTLSFAVYSRFPVVPETVRPGALIKVEWAEERQFNDLVEELMEAGMRGKQIFQAKNSLCFTAQARICIASLRKQQKSW